MGNEVLNIFSLNNFFEESNILRENGETKFLGDVTIFLNMGSSYPKNDYDIFITNLILNIFMINSFFRKSSIFWGNCRKLFWEYIRPFLLHFYYITLARYTFLVIFFISVALPLLPIYDLSFSLFGGNWGSAVSGLATFPIRTSQIAIINYHYHNFQFERKKFLDTELWTCPLKAFGGGRK